MTIQDDLEDIIQAYHDGLLDASVCEEWKGSRKGNRYGRFRSKGEKVLAHRWIYEQIHGPVDPDLVIRHRCVKADGSTFGNPWCLNPHHLMVGTMADNMHDAQEDGMLPIVQCGTWSGYQAHKKKGEDACEECRLAMNAYLRQRADADPERNRATSKKSQAAFREREKAKDPAAWQERQDRYHANRRAKRAAAKVETATTTGGIAPGRFK